MMYCVRWIDDKGVTHRKEYQLEKDARKAKQWLMDHGSPSVDIAVMINKKEVIMGENSKTTPVKDGNSTQQKFI